LGAKFSAMFNPVEGELQSGEEVRYSLDGSTSFIAQAPLRVLCLGFGRSVLDEVEVCHFPCFVAHENSKPERKSVL
jgi:hypothetical protein